MPSTTEAVGLRYALNQDGGRADSGPPLVLIHGAGGHRLFWPPQIRHLPGRPVYAIDLPGHGESTAPPESTIGGYAARLLDWMRAVDLSDAVLAGHSMGAAVALTAALRSDSVVGLVLIGAGASLPVHPELLQLTESRQTFPTAVDRVVRGSFSRTSDKRLVELAHQRMLDSDPSVFHMDFVACSHYDVSRQLAQVECPVLVICGADDRMTRAEQNQTLADGIRRSEIVIVPDAGHMVMLERPDVVAETMGRFLGALRPDGRRA
jgi:pimeloyl-ACP methyl ester carboxylesterase